MTVRQWRLMINGEVVDVEDRRGSVPEERAAPPRVGAMTKGQRRGWMVLGAGAAFEVLLSVAALVMVGPGWTMLLLAAFALLLLLVGSVANR